MNPRGTGLAMAAALIAILFVLTACGSDSEESEERLRATLASEQAKLASVNEETTHAEACNAQVSGWTRDMEQFDVPDGCIGAGDAGRIASKMVSLAAGLKDEIRRLELQLQSAVSRIDIEKERADDTEARMREDAEKTSELREVLAQAQQDLVKHQLESAEKINEGAKTIVDSTVNMTTTRSEISEGSGATWLARFDSLEDAHDDLMEQRVHLADEKAQLDAKVAEYVQRNTKVERERLEAEKKQAQQQAQQLVAAANQRVAAAEQQVTAAEEAAERQVAAAEQRAAASEETREGAIIARLHAEKEADKTTVTYNTKLEELSKKEAEFNSKKASNDAKCRSAWNRIDAEIENILQQTSLLPPANDDAERTSRVANIQYKMNVIRLLWSEFADDCRVSR